LRQQLQSPPPHAAGVHLQGTFLPPLIATKLSSAAVLAALPASGGHEHRLRQQLQSPPPHAAAVHLQGMFLAAAAFASAAV
jgi:hypothetical protein